jgi:hypothetical protein
VSPGVYRRRAIAPTRAAGIALSVPSRRTRTLSASQTSPIRHADGCLTPVPDFGTDAVGPSSLASPRREVHRPRKEHPSRARLALMPTVWASHAPVHDTESAASASSSNHELGAWLGRYSVRNRRLAQRPEATWWCASPRRIPTGPLPRRVSAIRSRGSPSARAARRSSSGLVPVHPI